MCTFAPPKSKKITGTANKTTKLGTLNSRGAIFSDDEWDEE